MRPEVLLLTMTMTLGSHVTVAAPTNSAPTSTFDTPPPPGETYTTGYPLCRIPGFTQVPGNYTETIHQSSNDTLKCCHEQCRSAFPGCVSYAFNKVYEECLFFDKAVEDTQLVRDNSSDFVHYDLECHVH